MARIRTIKPEFFRHELLQDLAAEHGAEIMLVFAGLWGHCDSEGRFEWRPRQLKLDILPFLDFSMAEILDLLETAGLVKPGSVRETLWRHRNIQGTSETDRERGARWRETPGTY